MEKNTQFFNVKGTFSEKNKSMCVKVNNPTELLTAKQAVSRI